MAELKVVKGDATDPHGHGNNIITHVVNNVGGWGAGFVTAISNRWHDPEREYLKWYNDHWKSDSTFRLGEIQMVEVGKELWVCNMLAQSSIFTNLPPIRYDALELCLKKVAKQAKLLNASVHMPRIGCGLAGGNWKEVGPIVQQTLVDQGVEVTVYDYKSARS